MQSVQTKGSQVSGIKGKSKFDLALSQFNGKLNSSLFNTERIDKQLGKVDLFLQKYNNEWDDIRERADKESYFFKKVKVAAAPSENFQQVLTLMNDINNSDLKRQ
mmetsp:Transcript_39359/g.37801  ORF Transcript_39359/g.37801 Transcript_39359/m.37801 type:complete len:105 (-) Transcript_39359:550-864(-)